MPNLYEEASFGALFVLEEDVPNEMIDEVLKKNEEEVQDYQLWLADESLEGLLADSFDERATEPPIPSTWRSPLIGKTIEAAFEFMATIPLNRSLIREYIAVLDKHLYEKKGWVVLHRIDEMGEINSIPCEAGLAMLQMGSTGYSSPDGWPSALKNWREYGQPLMGDEPEGRP
ncbi:hypothetical protein MBLNU459_g3567t1 [Dothideomycetes sp. NU459]